MRLKVGAGARFAIRATDATRDFLVAERSTRRVAVRRKTMRAFLRYWLPVVGWMLLIAIASTDLMSAQHTSRFIGPFLRWLHPDIAIETVHAVQFAIRKAAHVTEYAILAALVVRAMRGGARRVRWVDGVVGVSVASCYAALDEYHQSFVASRTGSPWDVAIDSCGAVLGVLAFRWAALQRHQRDAHSASPANAVARR